MSVNGPQNPMGPSRPEAIVPPQAETPTTNHYSPADSQYIPPLQSWPPQGHQVPQFSTAPAVAQERHSVAVPWIFVGLGLLIPLSALITGVWALFKLREREDSRYLVIGIVGILLAVALVYIGMQDAKDEAASGFTTLPGQSSEQPATP